MEGNINQGGYFESESPPAYEDTKGSGQQGHGPNQGNIPQQGCSPQQGFPPQQGHPPQQGYTPQQGFPPQQGYPPPQQGYPPPQGYAPQGGFPPQQQQQQQVVVVNTVAQAPAPTTIIRTVQVQPNDYRMAAVLVTLFCCRLFGIIALVYSCQKVTTPCIKVRSRFQNGDYDGAEESSRKAKIFVNLGVAIGVLLTIAYVVIVAINSSSGGY